MAIDKKRAGVIDDVSLPAAKGSGYAMVDGKRINYGDIGSNRDPLNKSGGYVMPNPAAGGLSASPADPNIALADEQYQYEVARAQRVQDEATPAPTTIADLVTQGFTSKLNSRKAAITAHNARLALDRQRLYQQAQDSTNDFGLRRELGLSKLRLDQGQQDETARHNKAMEGLKKSEIEKTGVDVKDTDMIRNMNYLVQSGVATDAKDAHAILSGKKGGRDDFVSRVVQARIKSYHDNQLLNKDPLDMNQVINEANQAADKLFPNSRQGQSVPAAPQPSAPAPTTQQATAPAISPTSAAPSAFDPYVFRPVSQGLNDGSYTKNLRELGIKAKRPNIETFFNSK